MGCAQPDHSTIAVFVSLIDEAVINKFTDEFERKKGKIRKAIETLTKSHKYNDSVTEDDLQRQ